MNDKKPPLKDVGTKPKSKMVIDDLESESKGKKGVSFFSGAVLVVLVLAAIFSFSIVAIELGEIKRLWGLKESTQQQIQDNEKKIDSLKSSIVTLQDEKAAHDRNATESNENARKQYQQYLFYESKRKEAETKAEEALNTVKSSKLKNEQLLLEITSNETKGADLLNQKNLLFREVESLTEEKQELAKYSNLISATKAEFKDAETQLIEVRTETAALQKQKELNEETATRLQARLEQLEKLNGKLFKDLASSEESLRIAQKEKEKLDEQSAAIRGALNSVTEQKAEVEATYNSLVQNISKLSSDRDALNEQIQKLSQTYGKRVSEYQNNMKKWEAAIKARKAEAQK
jgi:chromosome segregation ATPase